MLSQDGRKWRFQNVIYDLEYQCTSSFKLGYFAAIFICNVESLTNNKHFDQLSLMFKIIGGGGGGQPHTLVATRVWGWTPPPPPPPPPPCPFLCVIEKFQGIFLCMIKEKLFETKLCTSSDITYYIHILSLKEISKLSAKPNCKSFLAIKIFSRNIFPRIHRYFQVWYI